MKAKPVFRSVLEAEWLALWATGGIRIGSIVAAITAIGTGLLVFFILDTIAEEPSLVISTAPIEASSAIFAVAFGLVAAVAVGRDSEGRLAFTMLCTPVRTRLLTARAVSIVGMGMLGAMACSVVVAVVCAVFALPYSANALPLAGVAVLTHIVVVGLSTLISFGLSTIVRRSVASVLIFLALFVVLPLTLAVSGAAIPGGLGSAIASASAWTPTPLLMQAVALSTFPSEGPASLMIGLVGLLGWAVVTTVVSYATFARRDAP